MKKYLYSCLALLALSGQAHAQTEGGNTAKIKELLAQLPAGNSSKLNSAMDAIASMGKPGLVQIATSLVPAGKGDNAKAQYAIGGFTYAATASGKEAWRKMAAEAYGEALLKTTDTDNQVFLIYQLQTVGKDESVDVLKGYLTDEKLAGPAARALARNGSASAGAALDQALNSASGLPRLAIIEALGNCRYAPATSKIEKTATSDDIQLRKVSLFALSEIGVPTSQSIMATSAQKVSYGYDEADATAVYIKYLARLGQNGSGDAAAKAALELIKNTPAPAQSATRSSALKVYSDIKKRESVTVLVNAMSSTDPEYRASALKLGQKYTMANGTAPWLAALKKSTPVVQAEIITMLGHAGATDALPTLLKLTTSKDTQVKSAAIWSSGKIGGAKSLPSLIAALKTATPQEVQVIKSSLLTIKGAEVADQLAIALPKLPATAQPAAIEVLAARSADSKLPVVKPFLKNSNQDVKKAAYISLASLSTTKDLPFLYDLLESASSKDEISSTQNAIGTVVTSEGNVSSQSDILLKQMGAASASTQAKYLPILAAVGGKKALTAVSSAYNNGDPATKKIAIESLSMWNDASASDELLSIAAKTSDASELDLAINGYVAATVKSSETPANKVIQLRDAMALAKTAEQKNLILKELARFRTFNALLFAGTYLDDASVQQTAAQTVITIGLANKDFYGAEIKSILTKASTIFSGQDSEYQKQAVKKQLAEMPQDAGFVSIFNEKDLSGWKGLVQNPIKRSRMSADTLAALQKKADDAAKADWYVKDGVLIFSGHGDNLCTVKQYGDFEMYVDWKIEKKGDAGIYLRGTPQVQIWDTSRVEVGAQVGSGGLYNNQKYESKPSKVADNAIGEWNTFHITMVGDRVSVDLNGVNVVNNVTLENYWDRKMPIFPTEQIELQAHGNTIYYRDIYVREIARPEPYQLTADEQKEGYKVLFDGTNTFEWTGNKMDYFIQDGNLVIDPTRGGKGNLYTKDEYSDFVYRFEFQLTPGANNGLGIRTPLEGDGAYVGTEIQILDNDADKYKDLKEYQYHGSAYGIIPAKRGYLKPVGEWNQEEVYLKGSKIRVTLNGTVILDGDLAEASKNGTADHRDHPGLQRTSGHIGYLGHGDPLKFRNIRILDLSKVTPAPAEPEKGKKSKKKK